MGLDSVEILMKVEDTFGIKIPDQEAQQILTVRDFHSTVWRHVSGRHNSICRSQRLFYILRRSFAEKFEYPRRNRRQQYLQFSADTDLDLPDLVLERSWQTLLTGVGFASIAGGLLTSLTLIFFFNYSNWMLLLPVAGIVATSLFSELLNQKRTEISNGTMRDFTQQILALNYKKLAKSEGINRQEMELVVNYIIADKAGLDLEEVTPGKKIGDDLGID
ncbi:hypothetical protein LZZ85_22660 [Terrimonas sp. NA20]|uniref:Carrier domain-containing protein n=1 Tax=Terrimonas ginsenosidimutans TaxID=2908004 RepID=A0ABS9KXS8_9BACT|nr:hypothetical protein [Terrimonas ginsenosidimutans]MCG2617115.1 hypothetical protein [Terrimonas ginsenosidimutans]